MARAHFIGQRRSTRAVIDDLEVAPEPQGALVDPRREYVGTRTHAVAVMPG